MNFVTAKTAVKLGMQIRMTRDYGAFPIHIPEGATGTVIANDLGADDPSLRVRMDDWHDSLPHGVLQIRGPEEAFPVGIVDLAYQALDFDPERNIGTDPGETVKIDERLKVGRWTQAAPFEIVDPPTSPVAARRIALSDYRDELENQHFMNKMSDNRYAVSGRMDWFEARIRALETVIDALN